MRIAMISTPFVPVPPRDYGGTELVVHELVEGLLDRGHDVTLFATGDSRTRASLRALYVRAQWPPEEITDLNHCSWSMREVARGDFDLVHAHSAPALALARLVPKTPMVYTLHHVHMPALSEYYRHFPDVSFVAISADQAGRETTVRRRTVIHHGLDPAGYRWTEHPEPYVCFVGRLALEKGPHTAIEVARAAGVPIRVAGDVHPPDHDYARTELAPLLQRPEVTFLGPVDMEQKVPLLRDARALLAPITWNEPFGLILIEAMLSGCPVVAFGRGSVPELIESGVTGYVVESAEEMARVVRSGGAVDRLDRRRIRAAALQRFTHRRMAADYERLYRARMPLAPGAGSQPITAA
jgi:glycosyltransferase involved in cell wall biosynthesis